MLIKNDFNENTFFVGKLVFPNGRQIHKILPAKNMAALINEFNVAEHFNTTIDCVKEVSVVEAVKRVYSNQEPEQESEQYLKFNQELFENWATTRRFHSKKPDAIIVEAICFDRVCNDYADDLPTLANYKKACDRIYNLCSTAYGIRATACIIHDKRVEVK